ncbi:hypothetical protein IMW82_13500 [Rhodanobacter sp. B2A1Ga4]|jgi:hypothetical protein|uniref:hypothetical protein n=1 Tax=Rhodanobacter sp. B2A1Ga4 TaxID=2778647 RepID=UPI001B38C53A|nr:hypothetical protein [Rhodanobacter sp. B2A1Ga4]MBQ4855687.1 hypothetical protein [Rhodanobacter sp. B2A1Ga4]
MNQLQAYVEAHGPHLTVDGRQLTFCGLSSDADLAVATFTTSRASYTAVMCPLATLHQRPGAEVWAVVGGRRTIAKFALHAGELVPLR